MAGLTKPKPWAQVPRTPDGKPDLQGTFNAATLTPARNVFPTLETLNVQVLRMTLTWGGRGGVASRCKPRPSPYNQVNRAGELAS